MTRFVALVGLFLAGCGASAVVSQQAVAPGDEVRERCPLRAPIARSLELDAPYQLPGYWEPGLLTLADGNRLVVSATGTTGTNRPDDRELVLVDLDSGEQVQLTANDEWDHLLDVRDGRLLYTHGWDRGDVLLGDFAGGPPLLIGQGATPGYLLDAFVYRPRRLLGTSHVVWRTSRGIELYRDGTLTTIVPGSPPLAGNPMLDGDTVVWEQWSASGERGVFEMSHGGLMKLSGDEYTRHFDATGGRVIWGTADGVGVYEDGATRYLQVDSEQGCTAPFLAGDQAAFVCGGDVWRYDFAQDELTRVASTDGIAAGPRLSKQGHLAWVVFTDGCGETGTVYVEGPNGPLEIADVQADAFCVGHMPVPMSLQINDEFVVWNDLFGVYYAPLVCEG